MRLRIVPDIGAVVVIYLGGCIASLGFMVAVVWIIAVAVKWGLS